MEKNPKKPHKNFYCKKCDFSSNNKKDFSRHLSTTKHKTDNTGNIMDNIMDNKKSGIFPKYMLIFALKLTHVVKNI